MKWLLVASLLIPTKNLLSSEHGKKEEPKKAEGGHGAKPAPKKEEKKAEGHGGGGEKRKEEPKKAEGGHGGGGGGEKKAEGGHGGGGEKKEATKITPAMVIPQKEGLFPEKDFYTRAEVDALREVLDQKTTQLDQNIESEKKYMESLKVQTEDHLNKINAARTEISDFMNTRDEKEEGKLKKLAKFYEAMDAEQAAPLLKTVDDDLAIKIFDRMDAKKAGAILAQLPAPRAAKITAKFPKLKIQSDQTAAAEK